ncbi:hypothetical protein QEH68_16070 [Paenarthrobacter sp. OM7]|uniref:hypothetical protein n=1 Tax=Paenarthrobacter sp. OM7 TaxID=3041264 RepID=UPI002468B77B|nr:hypothetical protein [Paenarthrobacter sp. OM7]WGM19524.1 hypothetical protein QEH68_16070 [Paenarthrobacter sp. OM7]
MGDTGMRRVTKVGFALLALLALTAAGCDERSFTRDYARSVPNSVIQVGEKTDRTWEYVDRDGVSRGLNTCEDLSPWNGAYSCKSPDGTVELTFSVSKRMRNPTLHVVNEEVPLYCINNGFWGDGLRFCIPASDPAVPPQPVPRRD